MALSPLSVFVIENTEAWVVCVRMEIIVLIFKIQSSE